MSVRYEWFDVEHPFFAVEWMKPGTDVRTGLPADEDTTDEYLVERGAVVIAADEVTVLHGHPAALRAMLRTALHQLPPDPVVGE